MRLGVLIAIFCLLGMGNSKAEPVRESDSEVWITGRSKDGNSIERRITLSSQHSSETTVLSWSSPEWIINSKLSNEGLVSFAAASPYQEKPIISVEGLASSINAVVAPKSKNWSLQWASFKKSIESTNFSATVKCKLDPTGEVLEFSDFYSWKRFETLPETSDDYYLQVEQHSTQGNFAVIFVDQRYGKNFQSFYSINTSDRSKYLKVEFHGNSIYGPIVHPLTVTCN